MNLSRSLPTAGAADVWFELEAPLPLETLVRWWRLLPILLPAILLGYFGNTLVAWSAGLLPDTAPLSAPLGVARAGLLLLVSWLGQSWASAAVLLAATGGPVTVGRVARWLRDTAQLGLLALLARSGLVYAPVVLVVLIGASSPGSAQQVGQINLLPLAALLLLPLSLVLAVLFGLLPVAALTTSAGGLSEVFRRAREWGDASFLALLFWGGLIVVSAAATSFLPLTPPVLFPNHAVGSVLWVLLPVAWLRARRRAEPELTPARLTAELARPA